MWVQIAVGIVVGLVPATGAIVLSLPRRIANWNMRAVWLKSEIERVEDERLTALAAIDTQFTSKVRRLVPLHQVVPTPLTPQAQQYAVAQKERADAVAAAARGSERAKNAIQGELDASWLTHWFADDCQGGREYSWRDVLPAPAAEPEKPGQLPPGA